MNKTTELTLFQKQNSPAFDYTRATAVAATMGASDLLEVMKDSEFDWDPQVEPVELCAGSLDQDAAVPGDEPFAGTVRLPVTPGLSSGTVAPYWMKVMDACCGYLLGTTTTAGASRFQLTPMNAITSAGIIKHYTGDTSANGSIAITGYNLAADWKISFEAGKYTKIEFPLTGATGIIADATQPTVTKARVSPDSFKGATITFGGVATYKILKIELSGNQSPSNDVDPSQASGRGESQITDRKVKGTARVYMKALATQDPVSALRNSTESAISMQWGSGSRVCKGSGSYMQITKSKRSDENGKTVWDIEFQCNRNNFVFDVYPA